MHTLALQVENPAARTVGAVTVGFPRSQLHFTRDFTRAPQLAEAQPLLSSYKQVKGWGWTD